MPSAQPLLTPPASSWRNRRDHQAMMTTHSVHQAPHERTRTRNHNNVHNHENTRRLVFFGGGHKQGTMEGIVNPWPPHSYLMPNPPSLFCQKQWEPRRGSDEIANLHGMLSYLFWLLLVVCLIGRPALQQTPMCPKHPPISVTHPRPSSILAPDLGYRVNHPGIGFHVLQPVKSW